MSLTLFSCIGGTLTLPVAEKLLIDRVDGGNLVVHPPRPVWERSVLSADELKAWSFLVAACGEAMLATLPQLEGGCLNYWEAGNWALNDSAEPEGPKTAPQHRRMHLHLLGRSRFSKNPNLEWGESPRFPAYAERHNWARDYVRLDAADCVAIVTYAEHTLRAKFSFADSEINAWSTCSSCGYPSIAELSVSCVECAARC